MINVQYINLNLIPSGVMPTLYCSQYDVGRPLGMVVYNGAESVDLSEYTCTIEATRTDRTPITAGVTTDGNIGVFETTATMTNQADTYKAKFVIVDGNGKRVASLAFVLCVTAATMDENAESIEEDASLYQQYTGTVQTIIAAIRADLAAEITARQNAVSAEATARQNAITAEANARAAAVSAEAAARQSADNTLQSNINAEASTRATADASLQSQIDQIIAPSGEAPSAAEVENARIGSDGTVYPTLGDAIRTQNSNLKSQLDKGIYAPVLRNGSVANESNVNGVAPINIIPINDAEKFTILVTKPLASGAVKRRFQLSTFTVATGNASANRNNRILIDYNFDTTDAGLTVTRDVYDTAIGFACAIYDFDANDSPIAIRITDFAPGDYVVLFDYNFETVDNSRFFGYSEFKTDTLLGRPKNLLQFDGLNHSGYIVGSTGKFSRGVSGSGLNCCTDYIRVTPGSTLELINTDQFSYNLVEYDADLNRVGSHYEIVTYTTIQLNASTKYIRMSFNDTLTNYDAAYLYEVGVLPDPVCQSTFWRNGSVTNINNANGIAVRNILPNNGAKSLTVLIDKLADTGHKYRYQLNTFPISNGKSDAHTSERITVDKTYISTENHWTFSLDDGSIGFGIAIYELDENDTYVPLRVNTFDTTKIHFIRHYESSLTEADGYVVSPGFMKTPIRAQLLGTLSAQQSFCIYDGHYFSISGSNLYEQDASFTLVSTTALNLGHGNAFQLGHNGKAYASGWDDNKVYVVDLATKTIESTIDLPTTGYTTCAVDDINGLMYIFQRDTRPGSANENYNMITYDYVNDNIISTKKTTRSYGAMQSCDFIDGKIFVLYGYGSETIPNGYMILNTSGDIIAEYVMTAFATSEPEGVFVDRDTYEVYMSFVDQKTYKIIQM